MNRSPQTFPTVIVNNIVPYLHNRYIRLWVQFVITPNESYYLHEGKKLTVDEFDSLYPVVKLETIND